MAVACGEGVHLQARVQPESLLLRSSHRAALLGTRSPGAVPSRLLGSHPCTTTALSLRPSHSPLCACTRGLKLYPQGSDADWKGHMEPPLHQHIG